MARRYGHGPQRPLRLPHPLLLPLCPLHARRASLSCPLPSRRPPGSCLTVDSPGKKREQPFLLRARPLSFSGRPVQQAHVSWPLLSRAVLYPCHGLHQPLCHGTYLRPSHRTYPWPCRHGVHGRPGHGAYLPLSHDANRMPFSASHPSWPRPTCLMFSMQTPSFPMPSAQLLACRLLRVPHGPVTEQKPCPAGPDSDRGEQDARQIQKRKTRAAQPPPHKTSDAERDTHAAISRYA